MRRVVLATAALAASMTLVAAPAFAAAPVGYALTWASTTLYQLEDGTTPVEVENSTGVDSVTGLDFDTDGKGYAVTFDLVSQLWSVDVTGQATFVGDIADAAAATARNCTALDYTAGVISVACDQVGTNGFAFGTVDPTTAVFTLVQLLPTRVASIAHDPISGVMYGFGYSGEVLSIGGGVTQVGTVPGNATLWGADFDSTGALWAATDTPATSVLGWPLVTIPYQGYNPAVSEFIENISVYEAAAVAPVDEQPAAAPELAATGMESGTTALVGLAGALSLLAGIALAIVTRRLALQQ